MRTVMTLVFLSFATAFSYNSNANPLLKAKTTCDLKAACEQRAKCIKDCADAWLACFTQITPPEKTCIEATDIANSICEQIGNDDPECKAAQEAAARCWTNYRNKVKKCDDDLNTCKLACKAQFIKTCEGLYCEE